MAIMDYRLEFCDATAVSGATGATVVGNVIDMGANATDWGSGTPVWLHLRMKTAAGRNVGVPTLAFVLENAATNTPASFGTALTLKAATTYASYTAGFKVYEAVLPAISLKRYLRLKCTIATSACTSGQLDAYMSLSAV
jgi:hypothetical protein